jgi:hypothetical protein
MAEADNMGGGGLDSLAGMVADADAGAAAALNPGMGAPGAQADIQQGPDYMRGASGIVDLAHAALEGFVPGAGWPDKQREVMAASIAPVLEKYGWDVESKLPCELLAALACGPALYHSYRVVMTKLQNDRIEMLRAARGLADPNTVAGQAAAQAQPQTAADALAQAMASAPQFPDM